ncbi:MAG: PriCT-2 domain-containing protein [Synergistaceae bacterium]|nr:PriCT-2 domain-containing protein [Synergistaceae bacterium]
MNNTKYTNIDDILNDVLHLFEPILNNYGYNNYPVIILNATTRIKFSLHILFPTIVFKSILIMNHFINSIDSDLINNVIDKSVYRTGCFRLLHCSKKGKNNKLKYYKSFNYEFINDKTLFDDCLITNITTKTFIDYKYVEPKTDKPKNNDTNNKSKSIICQTLTDDEIINILNKLPIEYLNNYDRWLVVLNVMKGLNKYDIWNEWCKKSDKYDARKNLYY